MPKSYVCNNADLYLGIESLCTACENNQAALFANKTTYTMAYFAELRADVQAARALPEADANVEKVLTVRRSLVDQTNELLKEYQKIKSYIEPLFDSKLWKEKFDLAGQTHYKDATHKDWTGLDNLMTKSTNFLTENEAALLSKGMPTDFKASYANTVTETRALRNEYLNKKQGVGTKNMTKKEANAALYETVKSICRDAKRFFDDPNFAAQFVWDNILNALGSTTGSTAKQRRKTVADKKKEKTVFEAKLLGVTIESYIDKLKAEAQAEKQAKKKKGKKGKKGKTTAAPEAVEYVTATIPLLLAAKE
jgi:hypothetical protein